MTFTSSSFHFQQTVLFESLHSSFSRRVAHLRRFQSSYPLNLKQWPRQSLEHSSIGSRKPDAKPRIPLTTFARAAFQDDDFPSVLTWIKSWGEKNRSHLFPKRPRVAHDYREGLSSDDEEFGNSASTGSSTLSKILENLKKSGCLDDSSEINERHLPEKGSVEDIFYEEDGILPDSRGGLSLDVNKEVVRFPWMKPPGDDNGEDSLLKKKNKTMFALPPAELKRLQHLGLRAKSKIKISSAGVTQKIVDTIQQQWKIEEIVRLKCEGLAALNMRRMHEILQRKTGGLVIWRSGASVLLYRGVSYASSKSVKRQYKSVPNIYVRPLSASKDIEKLTDDLKYIDQQVDHAKSIDVQNYNAENIDLEIGKQNEFRLASKIKYEDEMDKLLDGLGPRYTDWPGDDPLPVDADLLPGIVPGFRPLFRFLPFGVRATLGLKSCTALRRLARRLPPHFALGRSRQHQGLAAAMGKLWERSCIAKIALKRGMQLTTSERVAEEIKGLTGGILLSRNKDYIVFYRGKDFLSAEVSKALLERESLYKKLQDEEEQARIMASTAFSNLKEVEQTDVHRTAGTLGETLEADTKWGKKLDVDFEKKMITAAKVARQAGIVRRLEIKLHLAECKIARAKNVLAKVEKSLQPINRKTDPCSITEEERFMFRKLGLRMKAFLLLGRREVFDGTIENMHLHWRYRELVKIIMKSKNLMRVKKIASSLEAESGGVLVSVDKVSKGYAVVVYRGKDYHRPSTLRPKNLLTKRKALSRSIELQRQEALNHHISTLLQNIKKLKAELGNMEDRNEQEDNEVYRKPYLSCDRKVAEAKDEENEALVII